MKIKKILTPILLLAGGILCTTSVLNANSFNPSQAAYVDSIQVNENFDKRALSTDLWTTNDAELYADHYSLKFTPTRYDWGNHLVWDNHAIMDSCTVDVIAANSNLGGWLGFSFGCEASNNYFYQAQAAFIFYGKVNGGAFGYQGPNGMDTNKYKLLASPFTTTEKRLLRFHIDIINDYQTLVYYDIFTTNGALLYEHSLEDTFTVPYATGYMGLSVNKWEGEIFSITVKNLQDQVVYEEDFTESGIQYQTSGEGDWKTITLSEEDIQLGPTGLLYLPNLDSSALYNQKFVNPKSEKIDLYAQADFSIYFDDMDSSTKTGLEFTKESPTSEGCFAGVSKTETGYKMIINDPFNDYDFEQAYSNANGYINVRIQFFNSGCAYISWDDSEALIMLSDASGYFMLCSKMYATGGSKGGMIDNFVFTTCEEISKNNPDVAINFDGTREKEIFSDKYYEFFLSNKEWYKSSDTSLPQYNNDPETAPEHQNGYLSFNNCDGRSFFGSRNTYLNYIAKFDIQINTKASDLMEGTGISFGFGMPNFGDFTGNYRTFNLIHATEGGSRVVMSLNNCLFDNGEGAMDIPTEKYRNMFDAGLTYNFVIVVDNNVVSIYFKSSDANESELDTPKAVIHVDSTDGYCGVFGNNTISFSLDNYSVTNLELDTPCYEYVENEDEDGIYQTNTRIDYSTMTSHNGVETSNCTVSQKTLKINDGGKITSKGVMRNHIARLNVASIEEKLVYKLGGVSIELVDKSSERYINIIDKAGSNKIALPSGFSFMNSFFEFRFIGSSLTVSYASGNEPLFNYLENSLSLAISASEDYSQLEITSYGLSKINSLTLLNLDSNQAIKDRNYDPNKDAVEVWEYREDPNEKKSGGCGSSIIASSLLISTIAIIGTCLLVSNKSRKEDK